MQVEQQIWSSGCVVVWREDTRELTVLLARLTLRVLCLLWSVHMSHAALDSSATLAPAMVTASPVRMPTVRVGCQMVLWPLLFCRGATQASASLRGDRWGDTRHISAMLHHHDDHRHTAGCLASGGLG
jgi:hypothetical protein